MQGVHDGVHQVVANVGAGCVGNAGRNIVVKHLLNHCFDWQIGEISVRTALDNSLTAGNITGIIRSCAVVHIDANAFWGDIRSASGLTDTKNEIRSDFPCFGGDDFTCLTKDNRNFQFDDFRTENLVGQ